MLQQAYYSTTDPLLDSDDEFQDENMRLELQRRLNVITRLRGKSPTPSPPLEQEHDFGGRMYYESGQGIDRQGSFTGQFQQAQWD